MEKNTCQFIDAFVDTREVTLAQEVTKLEQVVLNSLNPRIGAHGFMFLIIHFF